MKTTIGLLMLANAALFFFGAIQHGGIALGPFHEPYIIHATIAETLCGLALVCGALALLCNWKKSWGTPLTGNVIALAGVLLGMAALAVGGPRTASNDLYHRLMLILIAVATVALFFQRPRVDA